MSLNDEDRQYILQVANLLLSAVNKQMGVVSDNITTQLSDLRRMMIQDRVSENPVFLETDAPVAIYSDDHISPHGTKNDNTRSARFCRSCEQYFNRQLKALDLGCSGGGIVFDFLLRGHFAIGLEGSDYSLKSQRAEWATIGDNLFTCDITKPFSLKDKNTQDVQNFDIVSMWEVLEHIGENDLEELFANVKKHLASDGLFVGSIATFHDRVGDIDYHKTVMPRVWWENEFRRNGLTLIENTMFSFHDFCRGTGNGPLDRDFSVTPDWGFHFVATHYNG